MSYNLLDLRTRVRIKIKDSAYPSATIDSFINDAIQEITGIYLWKWTSRVNTADVLTVGQATFDNPSDLETLKRLILIDPDDASQFWDITKHRKENDYFFKIWTNAAELSNGLPSIWTEYANAIYFNCPADKAYIVSQHYQFIPEDLVNEADVPVFPVIFRESIVLGAAYRCEEERGNYDISGVLQGRFDTKTGDLIMRFANDTLSGPDTVVTVGGRRDD